MLYHQKSEALVTCIIEEQTKRRRKKDTTPKAMKMTMTKRYEQWCSVVNIEGLNQYIALLKCKK